MQIEDRGTIKSTGRDEPTGRDAPERIVADFDPPYVRARVRPGIEIRAQAWKAPRRGLVPVAAQVTYDHLHAEGPRRTQRSTGPT